MIRDRRWRGGGFFMFLVVLLPLTLIGFALIADYSRAILAGREMGNTADIVAMAAATGYAEPIEGTDAVGLSIPARLDPDLVQERAEEMMQVATENDMFPGDYTVELTDVTVSEDLATVSVTLEYRIPDYFIVGIFTSDSELREASGTVTRSASICRPDDPEREDRAGCAYPS